MAFSKLQSPIFIVMAFGIIVRLFLFFYFLPENKFFYDDDSFGYIQSAENVRLGNGFSWDKEPPIRPEGFRTPGYPLFLLFHKLVFGSYVPALVTQIFLVAATAHVIFIIGRKYLNRPGAGLAAATIFLFSPFSLMVSIQFLTQTLFTFFLVLAVLTWLKFLETSQNKYFIYSAVLLPLTALIRPIAFLILIPFFLSLVVFKFLRGGMINWKGIFLSFGAALIIFIGVLSPWMIRNYKTFGSFSLSTITYFQLYFYDLPYIYGKANGMSVAEASKFLEKDINGISGLVDQKTNYEYARDFKYSALLKERIIHYIIKMPGTAATARFELMFKFFVRDGIRYWIHYFREGPITGILFALVALERGLMLLIMLGMLFLFADNIHLENRDTLAVPTVLLFVILYFSLLTGVMASAGLRFPIEPFFLLLGIIGLTRIYESPHSEKICSVLFWWKGKL